MAKKKSTPGGKQALRDRAEQVLEERGRRATEDDGASADTLRLLHSLQVHEIELELQNEELLRARAEAEGHLERYQDLYEHAPIGYLSLDLDGVIEQINLTGARLLGRERALLVGQRLASIVATQSRPALTSCLAGLSAQEAAQTCEVLVQSEHGASTALELWGRRAADGREFRLAAVDITGRRRLEQQVARAQRLEAMGQLSAGVSHEYNNLLMGILGYAHHLKRRVAVDTEAYLFASKIIEISEQAARVSRQLLDFARPSGGQREALDIDRLVDGTLSTFGKLIGEDIVVHVDAKSQAHPEVDAEQIQDVLVNILLNARDAMPDGGRLRIETRLVRLESDLAAQLDLPAGRRMVRIAVVDTGTGMEPEVHARIFEPFYSTKPHGQGTGLGLAAALGIVRAHGGAIQVHSAPDDGTTVSLYLPCQPTRQ